MRADVLKNASFAVIFAAAGSARFGKIPGRIGGGGLRVFNTAPNDDGDFRVLIVRRISQRVPPYRRTLYYIYTVPPHNGTGRRVLTVKGQTYAQFDGRNRPRAGISETVCARGPSVLYLGFKSSAELGRRSVSEYVLIGREINSRPFFLVCPSTLPDRERERVLNGFVFFIFCTSSAVRFFLFRKQNFGRISIADIFIIGKSGIRESSSTDRNTEILRPSC